LQPDPPQVNNPLTLVKEIVAGKALQQSPLIQRLAAQLNLDFKGLTLIENPASGFNLVAATASGIPLRRTIPLLHSPR